MEVNFRKSRKMSIPKDLFDYNTVCYRISDLTEHYSNIETEISIRDKSRYVEAIFLELPNYPIYIDETTKRILVGAKVVQSYVDYLNNDFALANSLVKEFEGTYFKDLQPCYQRQFKLHNLNIVLISKADDSIVDLIKYTFR